MGTTASVLRLTATIIGSVGCCGGLFSLLFPGVLLSRGFGGLLFVGGLLLLLPRARQAPLRRTRQSKRAQVREMTRVRVILFYISLLVMQMGDWIWRDRSGYLIARLAGLALALFSLLVLLMTIRRILHPPEENTVTKEEPPV